jgi:hypothetical protein
MQFADPDWKPSQQLDTKTNLQEREVYNPQPINTEYREQTRWRETPPAPPQQEGYTGLRPYAGPAPQQMQGGNFRQRQYRRRGRGPWFWIIIAIIIISLMSVKGFGPDHPPFGKSPIEEKHYIVKGPPTIVINDTNGSIQVNVGQSKIDVTIQAVGDGNFSGNPNDFQVNPTQDGNTINTSIPADQQITVDLQVTVPQDAILQLRTGSGDINVAGVDGPMTLTTNSGAVDLTLPSNSPFHVDASTNSGSIDIPGVTPNSSGTRASGDVGASSQVQGTEVNIKTDSGSINVNLS